MSEPLVCAVMITNGRPKLSGRAVRCFNRQTYRNKLLYVLDTTPKPGTPCQAVTEWLPELGGIASIGALRNLANASAIGRYSPDIIINWDDDDWSHALRMASQVEQLSSTVIDRRMSGQGIVPAPAVGYSDLLWWDSTKLEAWMYTNGSNHYCLGTSLCYWPETWRKFPFPDPAIVGGHDVGEWPEAAAGQFGFPSIVHEAPMIIGEYHGANGACSISRPESPNVETNWKRVEQWDAYCRKTMAV